MGAPIGDYCGGCDVVPFEVSRGENGSFELASEKAANATAGQSQREHSARLSVCFSSLSFPFLLPTNYMYSPNFTIATFDRRCPPKPSWTGADVA